MKIQRGGGGGGGGVSASPPPNETLLLLLEQSTIKNGSTLTVMKVHSDYPYTCIVRAS